MAVVVKSHVPLTVKTAYVIYSMDYVLNANLDGWINLAVEVLFFKTNHSAEYYFYVFVSFQYVMMRLSVALEVTADFHALKTFAVSYLVPLNLCLHVSILKCEQEIFRKKLETLITKVFRK